MKFNILAFSKTVPLRDWQYAKEQDSIARFAHEIAARTMADKLCDVIGQPKVMTDTDALSVKLAWELAVGDADTQAEISAEIYRIAQQKAEEMTRSIVAEACRSIDHWGSDYGYSNIGKDVAKRFIYEAARRTKTTDHP